MKNLLTLLYILPFALCSQDAPVKEESKFSLGFSFSPDYCYRVLKPDAASQWIADHRDSIEVPKFGFTSGVNLDWHISQRFTLRAGMHLSDKGERIPIRDAVWITTSPTPDPTLPKRYSFNYHYLYLDFPVTVNFFILTKRTKLFLSAGISTNLFLTQMTTTYYEYENGETKRNRSFGNNGFNRINLALVGGIGLGFDISEKMFLRLEPTYRRSMFSIIDAPINGYLYSFGLNAGIYYQL